MTKGLIWILLPNWQLASRLTTSISNTASTKLRYKKKTALYITSCFTQLECVRFVFVGGIKGLAVAISRPTIDRPSFTVPHNKFGPSMAGLFYQPCNPLPHKSLERCPWLDFLLAKIQQFPEAPEFFEKYPQKRMPFFCCWLFFPTFALEINPQIPNKRKNRRLTHRHTQSWRSYSPNGNSGKICNENKFAKVLALGEDWSRLICCTVYQSLH